MKLRIPRLRRLAPAVMATALVSGLLGVQAATGPAAYAATSQFHGVNWADPNDNFITGPNVPVGLSTSDNYATTYTKSTEILKGFQAIGANTVRMGFNAATTSGSWWGSYTAALDAASALGMNVVVAPWLQGGKVSDTTSFYKMWDVMINKYGSNSHFYFDIMNEPGGYSASSLANFEASWLSRYSSVPRGRVIVPGSGNDQNLCTIGADSRLAGTLLSIHLYSMFGDSHTTESAWVSDFESHLCGYASRAVLTEFGVPMTTGVNYEGAKDGNNNVSYFYAMTDTVRSLGMGSILWTGVKEHSQTYGPGPCDNASCAITSLNGSGTSLSLSVTNQSGLARLQYGWGGSSGGGGGGGGGGTGYVRIQNHATGLYIDGMGRTTNGSNAGQYASSTSNNQQWTIVADGSYVRIQNRATGLFLDGEGRTTNGSAVGEWSSSTSNNQQWLEVTVGSYVKFQNRATGLYIDGAGLKTNGSDLDQWSNSTSNNQQWTIVS